MKNEKTRWKTTFSSHVWPPRKEDFGSIFAVDMQDGTALILHTTAEADIHRICTRLAFHKARIIGESISRTYFEWHHQRLTDLMNFPTINGNPFLLTSGRKIVLTEYFNGDGILDNCQGSWVYVIARDDGYFKIGLTATLLRRLRAISGQHDGVELVHAIPCDNRHRAEKFLHEQFSSVRKDGEWFALEDHMLNEILSYQHFENDFFANAT